MIMIEPPPLVLNMPAIIRPATKELIYPRDKLADLKLGLAPAFTPGFQQYQKPGLSFIGGAPQSDTVAKTTFTFSVDIGPATDNRVIVIAVGAAIGSGTVTAITGTIAGVTFTRLIDQSVSVSYGAIIAAVCPATAGSGVQTVSINGGSTNLTYMTIAAYLCDNIASITPTDTLINSANPSTGVINVAKDGLLFAVSRCGNAAPTYTWVGVNEDYDFTVGSTGRSASGGSYQATAAETNRTVTATRSVSGNNYNLVAASIR